jgi:hypothetical protein
LVWADHGTDSIFTADLDGKNIESIVTVTSPFAVTYYTDTGSQSAVPTHSPTKVPVPAPSYSFDPTLDPTAIPSFPPTPFPTYYWSRLYFTAGTTNGGSFLYMSMPDGGLGDEEPIQLTMGKDSDADKQMDLGVSWSRDPAYVYWIDGNGNSVKRKKMNENAMVAKTIWTSTVGDIYNLQVVDEWVFITGDSTNSLTKISLSGEKVKTFVTGIDSVTGLDVTTWNLAGGVEGGYKIFFASTKSGTVYSCHDDGNDLQALITDLTQPNDVM